MTAGWWLFLFVAVPASVFGVQQFWTGVRAAIEDEFERDEAKFQARAERPVGTRKGEL